MTAYIALLRGINVGGHKLIKMADLKRMFEALGLARVETFIQSGNVLFESDEAAEALRSRIEAQIAVTFGFAVPTVLRTVAELEHVIARCPFPADDLAEGESIYISFLAETPTPDGLARLAGYQSDTDEYRVDGREIYILCRKSVRETLFTNQFFEKKLGISATSRNWQTTVKLAQLGKALQTGD